jgi:hypothetical protein
MHRASRAMAKGSWTYLGRRAPCCDVAKDGVGAVGDGGVVRVQVGVRYVPAHGKLRIGCP